MTGEDRALAHGRRDRRRTGVAITLATAAVFALTKLPTDPLVPWALGALAILTIAAACTANPNPLHISLFCTFAAATRRFLPPAWPLWPFDRLIPLLGYAAVVLAVPRLRRSIPWLRPGRLDGRLLLFVLGTAVVSGTALAMWVRLAATDLSRYAGRVPELPLWALLLAGLGFAVLNAAMEEAAYRGIVMTALESALGTKVGPVFIQALLFGIAHYLRGFPNGGWGVAMTFAYGVALGVMRRMSGGLLAPWIAHTCADGVVFALITRSAL